MSSRLCILLALLLLTGLSPAQTPPAPKQEIPVPTSGRLDPAEADRHVLVPGDQLRFTIDALEEEHLDELFTVQADGTVLLPVVRRLTVRGKTVAELRPALLDGLRRYLRNPTFELSLHAVARQGVSVLGEVKSQGTYEVEMGSNVLDVLAKSGGLTEKADPEKAILQRGTEQFPVALRPQPEGPPPMTVRSGDILYVVEGVAVTVTGEVMKAGVHGISREAPDPRKALLAAGVKEEAALGRVRLVRANLPKPIVLDLTPGTNETLPPEASQLQTGDILVVPARAAVVLGSVGAPGAVPLRGGETLIDVLAVRVSKDSDLSQVAVVRAKNVRSEQREMEQYDMTDYFDPDSSEPKKIVPINDGDMVYVPERGRSIFDGGIMGFLTIVTLARSLLFF